MTAERSYLISTAALLLLLFSPVRAAEQDTVQAIIPWDAEGRVYQIDTRTLMFVGAVEGIMYIESSNGDLNEAFVMCPIEQKFRLDTGKTDAVAHCEISASPDSVAYAEFSCKGEIGACKGKFKLIDGEGALAGISGAGSLRVRSPLSSLVADLAAGAVIRVSSGLAVIKDLKYRIP
jgi:hypothetical protein